MASRKSAGLPIARLRNNMGFDAWESMERILGDAFAIVNRFGLTGSMISDAIAPQFLLTEGKRRLPWRIWKTKRSQKHARPSVDRR